jgi:outer membrane protein assembly factor BamB
MMNRRLTRSLTIATASVALVLAPTVAQASVAPTPDDTAMVAGGVYALAHYGDLTYVGGVFTKMSGKPRTNLGAVRANGTVDPTFVPSTNGKVDALAVSSDGSTVFLGGTFTTVDGTPRANLAAVDAVTGALLPDWSADTGGTNPAVQALTVHGDRLYVGGKFGSIDGTARGKMVALDPATGDVVTSFRPAPDANVTEIAVSPDGATVYAGGNFTQLGGQPRLVAGAVDATTGSATAFAPTVTGGKVITVTLSPDGSLFFAGTENNTVFGFNTTTSAQLWLAKLSGNTQAMACSDTELYLGGHFSQYLPTGAKRTFFASVSPTTGAVTSWDPDAIGRPKGVWALLIEGDHLHAGGVFTDFGTDPQRGYARFTGTP